MTVGFIIFLLAFAVTGLALDAAFYWRFQNMLEVFRTVPDGLDYRRFAFPRLIFVAGSALVVGWGSYTRPTDALLIIAGSGAFLVFSSYPHIAIYRQSSRIK
jgi:hypothetical protein